MVRSALLNAEEVASRLGVSPWRVYRLNAEGRLPGSVRIGPRSLRFDPRVLEEFIAAGGTQAEQGRGAA